MARERSELILADLIATRAERKPDFPVLTFECAGREDEVRTFAELNEHANRLAAGLIARGLERLWLVGLATDFCVAYSAIDARREGFEVTVVEDACQAHLGEWRGRTLGTLGATGCFSFQASKNLNSGEGGAILTSDDALAERLKDIPIDVLLNNAAILGEPNDQNLGSFDYELFGRVIDVNVIGTTKMAEAFLPHVEKSDMKKIVAITSTQGSIASVRSGSIAFYNTSKAALNMIMRSNSRALKNKGVTVALISPGQVDTDMMNLALDRAGVSFELLTPQQSAEAVINVIDQYGLELSGRFVAHTGTEIPW